MARLAEGVTFWLTGLSGAGKTTVGVELNACLKERGYPTELLDGDVIRTHLSKGLGFSKEDRDTNIRRIGWVADLLTRHHVMVIVAAISPYQSVREENRKQIGKYIEIFCDCPMPVLIQRDVKGLYKKALAGEIQHFTGVSDPYEAPQRPEVHLKTSEIQIKQAVSMILRSAELLGYLKPDFLPYAIDDKDLRAYLIQLGYHLAC